MFKLHRHRSSDRVGERFDFRFSNFRAVQVPAVSDRLFLSIVSVDTGKTIAKSSKVASRSGICQWPDTILEPIWFSKDEVSKEFEECQYKIVLSVGSIKTGIIGEIFLNLANFLNLVDPTAISLPLKRCNSGTVLQLKVQCLGTKSKLSGVRSSWKDMSPRLEERSPTNDDVDNRSDASDSTFNRGVRSSSENHLAGTTYQDEPGNRETSFSASGSHRSSNSGDSTVDRTNFSPRDNSNGGVYAGRQDSASSYVNYVSAGHGDDGFRSNNSSFGSRASVPNVLQGSTPKAFASGLGQLSMGTSDSSKDLLEAAGETIEELRDEAKMWERHSRKLKADLEMLKKECSENSSKMAAYDKQQPQPQPQLNAAYYGPPIPPQPPAYYGPPAAPRRSGPRCLFCFLFKVIALVVIALGTAFLVLWLIFRPDTPKAYADSAALSRFDLGAGNGGDLLQYNLTVDIRLRNPNRFGIHYDYAEAQAFYDGDRFGFDPLLPFYLGKKSDGRITATFSGSTVMTDDDVQRTYRRETREGFYYVKVKVYSDLSFKVRVFRLHDYKSKITCVLRLPVPAGGNANSTAMTTLGTRCDVDF